MFGIDRINAHKTFAIVLLLLCTIILFVGTLAYANTVILTWATVGSNPYALAFDSSGNLYVTNYGGTTISKITPSGSVTLTWATVGSNPYALAFDSSGNLYTANYTPGTVSKIIFPPNTHPGNPSFSNVTSTSLTVSWTAATNATSSNIYRCSGARCTPTLYHCELRNSQFQKPATITEAALSSGFCLRYDPSYL